MDQELQMLINTLYGNKLNENQLSNIIQMWNSNQNGYQDIMRKQAFAKMSAGTNKINPVAAQRAMNQTVGTTPKLGQDSYKFNKSQGRAVNDMSAIADFKQAFKQARQDGHKTFFWKKTKANPSGMFSTEIASQNETEGVAPQQPENTQQSTSQKAKITAQLDMDKLNSIMPQYQKPMYNHPYNFDKTQAMVESTKASLARQFRTNNIPRPMGNPGQNVMGDQYNKNYPYSFKEGGVAPLTGNGSFVDTIIEALNNNTDIKTISSLIQQSGQNPETIIKEIVSRAQEGDQAAAMAFSNLEKLMKNNTVAKLGTKLNYIQKLKGICPEGTEKIYLKNGGCMCAQKAKEGTKTSIKQTKTKMPTKYDEKRHERLAIGEAMGKNNKAQQDSLQTYRKLYNDMPASDKYKIGDQDPYGKNPKKKVQEKGCGGKTLVGRKKKK